jgi:hypothetical protein
MNYFFALIVQLILYLLFMIYDEYAGFLLAVILGAIFTAIWVISLVVELIQPSRVKKTYYRYMITGWLAPALALVGFFLLRGEIGWLQ